jgi:hypothetical protein
MVVVLGCYYCLLVDRADSRVVVSEMHHMYLRR